MIKRKRLWSAVAFPPGRDLLLSRLAWIKREPLIFIAASRETAKRHQGAALQKPQNFCESQRLKIYIKPSFSE